MCPLCSRFDNQLIADKRGGDAVQWKWATGGKNRRPVLTFTTRCHSAPAASAVSRKQLNAHHIPSVSYFYKINGKKTETYRFIDVIYVCVFFRRTGSVEKAPGFTHKVKLGSVTQRFLLVSGRRRSSREGMHVFQPQAAQVGGGVPPLFPELLLQQYPPGAA